MANYFQSTTQQLWLPYTRPPHPIAEELPFDKSSLTVRLKELLLEHYKASAFNNMYWNQTLPKIHGPPVRLMIDPSAAPIAIHIPLPIPLYWLDKVRADLDRDDHLCVIWPVPIGEAVTWCHRMVVCAKQYGKPRCTEDFQALNKYTTRETHHTHTPYKEARLVTPGKLKTIHTSNSISIILVDRVPQ